MYLSPHGEKIKTRDMCSKQLHNYLSLHMGRKSPRGICVANNFTTISVSTWGENHHVLVPILTRTRNNASRCIRVLFVNRKTYDVRCLRFLHADGSVRSCIPQHVEITHKQGKKSSSLVFHIRPPFFLTSNRLFTKIDPRLA
jgi:hypothetical protein